MPPAQQPGTGAKPYLSACAIYRNEASYLEEWLEFHRLVGVERFFLYNNGSVDSHREVLAPYIDDGIVALHEWPVSPQGHPVIGEDGATAERRPDAFAAYDNCLREHRDDSRWVAFIDVDEFLFSPTGQPISQLLTDYERWPAVGANWALFGTSGHRTRPTGLVIESYLHRSTDIEDNKFVKAIVDPTRTARCISAHAFDYTDGFIIDENRQPISGPPFGFTDSVSFSRLRVNHYWTKSEEEWKDKLVGRERLGRERGRVPRRMQFEASGRNLHAAFNDQRDEEILAYLPALREALRAARIRREECKPSAPALERRDSSS